MTLYFIRLVIYRFSWYLFFFSYLSVALFLDVASADDFFTKKDSMVFLHSPIRGAKVIAKDSHGAVVATAVTDSDGKYQLPTSSGATLIIQATTQNGNKYYGIGGNDVGNVTEISDFLVRLWCDELNLNPVAFFSGLSEATPIPDDDDFDKLVSRILSEESNALSLNYSIDIIHEPLNQAARRVLSSAHVSRGDSSLKTRVKGLYSAKDFIKTDPQTSNNDVLDGVRFVGRSANGYDANQYSALVANANFIGQNASWMRADYDFISSKRLSDIAIPGTHDSGTANVSGAWNGSAKTQNRRISTQLNDGIRYFDLRFVNNWDSKAPCPVVSDFYVNHGSYLSYRLNEVLDDIKNFLLSSNNSKEIVIFDLQDYAGYSVGSNAALFGYIQSYLNGFIIPRTVESDWATHTISELLALNTGKPNAGKVILLVSDNTLNAPPQGCGVAMEPRLWYARNQRVNGLYGAKSNWGASGEIAGDVLSQLSLSYAQQYSRRNDFDKYKDQNNKGYLNVLNFAPRPSDWWYAFVTEDLSDYSDREVNLAANQFGTCLTGIIGKYSWMGGHASQNSPAGLFNTPNIFMIDGYNSAFNNGLIWINSVYIKQTSSWKMTSRSDYVTFIRNLNRPSASDNILPNVQSMDETACF